MRIFGNSVAEDAAGVVAGTPVSDYRFLSDYPRLVHVRGTGD